jgi:hypothetical protein
LTASTANVSYHAFNFICLATFNLKKHSLRFLFIAFSLQHKTLKKKHYQLFIFQLYKVNVMGYTHWLVGWLVGWSIGWLVGQSSGWLVNPLVGWSILWLVEEGKGARG